MPLQPLGLSGLSEIAPLKVCGAALPRHEGSATVKSRRSSRFSSVRLINFWLRISDECPLVHVEPRVVDVETDRLGHDNSLKEEKIMSTSWRAGLERA
jgi:hypothetical protein